MPYLPPASLRHVQPYTTEPDVATPQNTKPGDVVTHGGESFRVEKVYTERNLTKSSVFKVRRRHAHAGWGKPCHISWRTYMKIDGRAHAVYPLKKERKP